MVRPIRSALTASAATLACAAAIAQPAPARACGGFFCDSSQPVNQSAERIIFTHDADGTVTAVIQIQYAGPAEEFAWVLPVAGSPEVNVSSNAAFQRLQLATNPQYQLTTRVEGTCRETDFSRGPPTFGSGAADGGATATDAGGPPVTVVDSGAVGPYDYVVISVDPAATPLSEVAVQWLNDNGYDISAEGAALLDPYLAGGMNLLAFRLTKGNDAGSIRPVTITFGTGMASIPIRPTAVAAVEDMGVMVWVLGEHRAVPANYLSLELNEALINWLSPGTTYDDVVNAAANEAGGQGFVTEMAGAASPLADAIWQSWERDQWATIRGATWAGREGELLSQVTSSYGALDGMRDAIAATVPVPAGVTLEELIACVACYYDWSTTEIDGLDPALFLASVETHVIEPMERTREMFTAQPYVTRFYTTMSAEEMTRDPAFDFNADLGDVSTLHQAERVIECSPSLDQLEAPWRVHLPGGETVRGTGSSWPFVAGDGSMPANSRIVRVGTEGEGDVVTDNTGTISEALRTHNVTIGTPVPGGGGCVCRVGAGSGGSRLGAILSMLALAGAIAARRRR